MLGILFGYFLILGGYFLDMFLYLGNIFGIAFGLPIFIIIYSIRLIDTGSPFFYQERVGKNMKGFMLVKFRTMVGGGGASALPSDFSSNQPPTAATIGT